MARPTTRSTIFSRCEAMILAGAANTSWTTAVGGGHSAPRL